MGRCIHCGRSAEPGFRDKTGLYCSESCALKEAEVRYQAHSITPWHSADARNPERQADLWRVRLKGEDYTLTLAELVQWLIEGRVGPIDPVQRGNLPWVRVCDAPPLNGLELWNARDPAQREYAAKFRPRLVAPKVAPSNGDVVPTFVPCPRCGGATVKNSFLVVLFAILFFPLGLFLLLLLPRFRCTSCGLRFQL
jgi:Uncharacterized conserved protein (DUF2367)